MKLIKFDLPLDGIKVKSLDELREHFTAEIIAHGRSGLLLRWLRSRGLTEEAGAVEKLGAAEMADEPLFRVLCGVFGIEVDELILSAMFGAAGQQASPGGASAKQIEATYGQMIAEMDIALDKVIAERSPLSAAVNPEVGREVQNRIRLAYLRSLAQEVSHPVVKALLAQRADALDTEINGQLDDAERRKARAVALAFKAIAQHFSLVAPEKASEATA
ncbi:hypothetical protein [Sphaerotilus sp.]|uniref:hypothetical protein n=1 Tax=Sphaerotilus sp. TaxID=2093942 RepID=UPI002ACD7E94|nr:hypothetical protein [Sphaerotilus sp.]MDZ7857439.1 hypothetical protein [Sphaerotilus sp.]